MEIVGNRKYIERYEVKEEHDAKWLKVFYHDMLSKEFFNITSKDYLLSLENEHKYSILKYLKNVNKPDKRKYEFLLEYPERKGQYNRWKQSTNPCTSYKVEGFDNTSEGMHTSWPLYWDGLKKSYGSTTFIRGTSIDWWNYAIGAFQGDLGSTESFPGPVLSSLGGIQIKFVYLWVRVASFADIFDFKICTRHCKHNSHLGIASILLISLIYS